MSISRRPSWVAPEHAGLREPKITIATDVSACATGTPKITHGPRLV
jgi:hypothetical protein